MTTGELQKKKTVSSLLYIKVKWVKTYRIRDHLEKCGTWIQAVGCSNFPTSSSVHSGPHLHLPAKLRLSKRRRWAQPRNGRWHHSDHTHAWLLARWIYQLLRLLLQTDSFIFATTLKYFFGIDSLIRYQHFTTISFAIDISRKNDYSTIRLTVCKLEIIRNPSLLFINR